MEDNMLCVEIPLPYLHHATYVAQHEGEPEVLSSVAELNGKEGFVIAPFAPSSECPVVLMHPDESKLLSAEGAENASRCGTSYVGMQQNLHRDAAESTSGRSSSGMTSVCTGDMTLRKSPKNTCSMRHFSFGASRRQ